MGRLKGELPRRVKLEISEARRHQLFPMTTPNFLTLALTVKYTDNIFEVDAKDVY